MTTSTQRVSSQPSGFPYWMQIILILCLGWVVIWIYRASLTPIYGEIQSTIGQHSDAQMGLIASFYFFAYTGMQIPAGILVDKFGKKAVLIPGFSLFIIATLIIGNATSISMIYMGSFLAGLGCGSYYGSAYSLSSENIPIEKRGLSTAIINSGSALGMGIGLIGSSLLVKSFHMPWQIMMYVIAVLLVIMTLVFAFVIKNHNPVPVKPAAPKAAEKTENSVQTAQPRKIKQLFAPRMIAAYFMYFATCYGYYMVVTWLPSFLQKERGFEGVAIGFSAALVAFSAIPGALFFSRLSDKFRHKKVSFIIALEISAAVMLIATVASPTSTILLISLVLYGLLGKLAVEPILISYVADNVPKTGYGTSFGVFNFFGMSSSVIAPFLTGIISDSTGSQVNAFYVAAVILVVCTAIFLLSNVKKST